MSDNDAASLGENLRRLGELTAALDSIGNEPAREAGSNLLRLVLDLHGVALARMAAMIAGADNGRALIEAMIADPYMRAVLLLHGLHPQEPGERLRAAIERLNPAWIERGFRIGLLGVEAGIARVRIHNDGGGEPVYLRQQEIEDALVEAAPDLDDVVFEIDGSAQQAA
jgi:hypothetical protein